LCRSPKESSLFKKRCCSHTKGDPVGYSPHIRRCKCEHSACKFVERSLVESNKCTRGPPIECTSAVHKNTRVVLNKKTVFVYVRSLSNLVTCFEPTYGMEYDTIRWKFLSELGPFAAVYFIRGSPHSAKCRTIAYGWFNGLYNLTGRIVFRSSGRAISPFQ
jgi:hypothetical protein